MRKYLFITLALVAFIGVSLLTRCYYDSEEYLYGNVACDTANVTYSGVIAPIMSQNCNSCHSGGSASAGVHTDSYTGLKTIADNGKLKSTTNNGTMPPSGKMDGCTLEKLNNWLNNGAKND